MAFSFDIDIDASDLQAKLARFGGALDAAMFNAVRDVQIRIADTAKGTRLFTDRTAALRSSIRAAEVSGRFSSGTLKAQVIAGGGTVRYARFVHDGTRGPYEIKPKRTQALRIPTGTGFVFRKRVPRHPGNRPRPYMTEAADAVRPQAPRIVQAYVTSAIRQAGLL